MPQLHLSPVHVQEHLASLVSDEMGGGHPWEPGREHGQAKGEVMGTADWMVCALSEGLAILSSRSFLPFGNKGFVSVFKDKLKSGFL